MTGKEIRERVRHALGILNLQQMRGIRQHERLDIRQPVEQQVMPLAPDLVVLQAARAYDGEHWLCDATGVVAPE
jgi:hypothetical protein